MAASLIPSLKLNDLRLKLIFPVYVLIVLASHDPVFSSDVGSFTGILQDVGLLVAAAGGALRLWSLGIIHKKVELARSGPYARTRNPLYLGTFLMGLGFAFDCEPGGLWIAALFAGLFLFIYRQKIREEERKLEQRFGDAYRAYCAAVPRFWPTLGRAGSTGPGFSWSRMVENKGIAFVGWFLLFLLAKDFMAGVVWPAIDGRVDFSGAVLAHYGHLRIFFGAP